MSLPLPESSTRNRSVSVGDSELPEHERKRPRLSGSQVDTPGVLPDPGTDTTAGSSPVVVPSVEEAKGNILPTPMSPEPSDVPMATSPTSKVTINTRPLSSQSMTLTNGSNMSDSKDTAPTSSQGSLTISDSGENMQPREATDSAAKGDADPAAVETISLSSSPSPDRDSPPIEVSAIEDFDQDPNQTQWTAISRPTSFTSGPIRPGFVHHTFPHSKVFPRGQTHKALQSFANVIQGIESNDHHTLFFDIKSWLSDFISRADDLPADFFDEDWIFWEQFYLLVQAVLKREQPGPGEASLDDVAEFLVDYGRLTNTMIRNDIKILRSYSETTEAKEMRSIPSVVSFQYFKYSLQLRSIPFYDRVVRFTQHVTVPDFVRTIGHPLLESGAVEMIDGLADLIEAIAEKLSKKLSWVSNLVSILDNIHPVLQSFTQQLRSYLHVGDETVCSLAALEAAAQKFFSKFAAIFEHATVKQLPWLTIDSCDKIVMASLPLAFGLVKEYPSIANSIVASAGVTSIRFTPDQVTEVAHYAWKFQLYQRLIKHGRMELRVYGIENTASTLLEVFNRHIKARAQPFGVVVQFVISFLRDNKFIKYILGVDSHPQIIGRSHNVIGFLGVAHTYSDEDTEYIWQTVLESQDPRAESEVLGVLAANFDHFDDSNVAYIGSKVLALPDRRLDKSMVDFIYRLITSSIPKVQEWARFKASVDRSTHQLHSMAVKLCLYLIRQAFSPQLCGSYLHSCVGKIQEALHALISDFRVRDISLLGLGEEEDAVAKQLLLDIESHGPFSCGAVVVVKMLARLRSGVISEWIQESQITPIVVSDIVHACQAVIACKNEVDHVTNVQFHEKLTCLNILLEQHLDNFTPELVDTLWANLLNSPTLPYTLRALAWKQFIPAPNREIPHNTVFEHLINDLLPQMNAENFNSEVLQFIQRSIGYEEQRSANKPVSPGEVIGIPGIERVWRVMLEAPAGTVELQASDFIIKQYLDGSRITDQPRSCIDATHLSLIDRCVKQVIASANRITKGFVDVNGVSEHADPITAERSQYLEFDRSLLFLKKFLNGLKVRPRYSPTPTPMFNQVMDEFQKRGDPINFSLQLGNDPKISTQSRTWQVGSENTPTEIWQSISDMTGWSDFTIIHGGRKVDWKSNNLTLAENKISHGRVIANRAADAFIKNPNRTAPPNVDAKLKTHFDELYDLLELDDRLAKEVFEFLTMFASQSHVGDLRSMSIPPDRLLPVDKPYKLKYFLRALRVCIEDESFSNDPNSDFLLYAVHTIISTLPRLRIPKSPSNVQISIAFGLIEALILAFRAKVPAETSQAYIVNHTMFLEQILKLWSSAIHFNGDRAGLPLPQVLIKAPFEALVEAALHDDRLWTPSKSNEGLQILFESAFLMQDRQDVRHGLIEVLSGLAGPFTIKLMSKADSSRAPRGRFDTATIEKCLLHLWELLLATIPAACNEPAKCQDLFDAAWYTFRRIGKSIDISDVDFHFGQWKELLLRHRHQEIIGHESTDFVVGGLSRLLIECCKHLSEAGHDFSSCGRFVRDLFSSFLFPPLSDTEMLLDQPLTPILDMKVRESLYDLILALGPSNFGDVLSELENDLVPQGSLIANIHLSRADYEPDHFFFSYLSSDRQALRSDVGYAGIRNLANTCYLNSLFTQLFMNVEFRDYILKLRVDNAEKQALIAELAKVFSHMQNSYNKDVNPETAVEQIVQYDGEAIDVTVQMDVDEFFNLLFDRIEAQITDAEARRQLNSFYGGNLVQQIKSKECAHISERIESFKALQVEIRGKARLEDSLRAYVEGEVLQGENKYSCTSCKKHVDAVKRACLKDVPDNLIFQLKRFDYDIMTGTRCKINDEFQFPDVIDISPYTLEALSDATVEVQPDIFELVGIIVHLGTAESGHYYSYIRHRPTVHDSKDAWVEFNDSEVKKFEPSQIAECCFGGLDTTGAYHYPRSYNGYMLFYQRSSSIQKINRKFTKHDVNNPIQLSLPKEINDYIALQNELYLRSYVAQDPVHAKFIRQLVEQMRHSDDGRCSGSHEDENRTIRVALTYLHQISGRWKELPEVEATMKKLNSYAQSCPTCAQEALDWTLSSDIVADLIVKSPYPALRKTFVAFFHKQ